MAKSRNIGGIYAELSLKDMNFRRGLKNAESSLGALSAGVGAMAKGVGVAAVAGGAAIAAGVTAGFVKAIGAAAEMETLETAFVPLLGGAEAAEKRLEELSKFAAATPFELPEIAKASKVLETLTRGALSTGKGLEMVGDIASATGRPFDEVALTIGRLYDGLQSGRPVGEAMARMQELGVISGDTRAKLEKLQKENAKGSEIWEVATEAMQRFSGSMELQSKTWNGKISTLRDNINLMFVEIGQPIIDRLNPYLDELISKDFTTLGQNLGESIATAFDLLISGDIWEVFSKHAEIAILKLDNKMGGFMNSFAAHLNALFDVVTGEGGFSEGVAKYSAAGLTVESDIADLRSQISDIMQRSRERIKPEEKKDEYGPTPQDFLSDSDLESIFGIKSAMESAPEALKDAAQPASFESAQYSANEMQRRGLGQGAMYAGKEDKKVTLITEIKNIIKEISLRPPTDPTWA